MPDDVLNEQEEQEGRKSEPTLSDVLKRMEEMEERHKEERAEWERKLAYERGRAEGSRSDYDEETYPATEREWAFAEYPLTVLNDFRRKYGDHLEDKDAAIVDGMVSDAVAKKRMFEKYHKTKKERLQTRRQGLVQQLVGADIKEDSDEYKAAMAAFDGGAEEDLIGRAIVKRRLQQKAGEEARSATARHAARSTSIEEDEAGDRLGSEEERVEVPVEEQIGGYFAGDNPLDEFGSTEDRLENWKPKHAVNRS